MDLGLKVLAVVMSSMFNHEEVQMKKSELIKAVAAAANVSPGVAKNSVHVIAPVIEGMANPPRLWTW